MTGWEVKDLISALKAAINEDDSTLSEFSALYGPLSTLTSSTFAILRRFEAVNYEDQRRIMNAQPKDVNHSQKGITIVQHDGSSGLMFSVCVPNDLDYQSIHLNEDEQLTITCRDKIVQTNLKELSYKLKQIYGLATEAEIAAAFDALFNENIVEPDNKPEVVSPTLYNDTLGTLTYNKKSGRYDTTYSLIHGRPADISIELIEADKQQELIEDVAKKLACQYYLHSMKAMLIPMLALKNDYWLGEGEAPLSVDEFVRHIVITDIVFYADGNSVIYCSAGDLFFGHCIVVDVDKDNEFIDANIAG